MSSDERQPREAVEEALPAEAEVHDTVACDGYCDAEVFEAATVDVVVGESLGEWHDGPLTVEGTDGSSPVHEQWCVTCAREEFGVGQGASAKRFQRTAMYVTMRTVSAFLLGLLLASVAFSVLLW